MKKTRSLLVIASVLALPVASMAKDKKTKPTAKDPQDEIAVVGQIPLSGGPVLRFLTTDHYSSHYLYAEHSAGRVTLIDVTKMTKPMVLSDLSYASGNLFTVTGTAALVAEQPQAAGASTSPQALRIMDFSDPKNPKVAREFLGVTAVSRDDRRGLIFVANGEGIWILHQNYAEDPEVEKAYTHHVLYDH